MPRFMADGVSPQPCNAKMHCWLERATVLGRLKILGRQAEDESPIFTKNVRLS